ncbi:UDP-glucose 4-epimerase [compost metagenome]
MPVKVLVTGAAGFIGFHTALRLCAEGHEVVGIDNLNDYYSVALKQARLDRLAACPGFRFQRLDIADQAGLFELFAGNAFEQVIHLAAQAGVRHSIEQPQDYLHSNLHGFLNLLEACRRHRPQHLLYASSSSVYGLSERLPFAIADAADRPASLYAASKRANELMAHSYAHLYGIPATGLRFFTVYGPWGRPDMALFRFTEAILRGRPLEVYGNGEMSRDLTYIDDVVEAIVRLLAHPPSAQQAVPWRLCNVGRGEPVTLLELIDCLENALGLRAQKHFLPLQPGEVPSTWADTTELAELIDFRPQVSLDAGVRRFVEWYRSHYAV